MPRWVTTVPIANPEDATPAEARRVGLAQADGDVVHLIDARDLVAGPAEERSGPIDWVRRLTAAGVARPEEPHGRAL